MLQLTIFTGPPHSGKTYQAQRAIKAAEDHTEPMFFEGVNNLEGFELLASLLSNNKVALINKQLLNAGFEFNVYDLKNLHIYATTLLPAESFKPLFEELPHVNIIQCNYQPPNLASI